MWKKILNLAQVLPLALAAACASTSLDPFNGNGDGGIGGGGASRSRASAMRASKGASTVFGASVMGTLHTGCAWIAKGEANA